MRTDCLARLWRRPLTLLPTESARSLPVIVATTAPSTPLGTADFPPDGDVAHGEAIYNGKGQCSTCHTIGGRGGLIGPDLTNLGSRSTVRRIREALTEAKPHPPAGYRPVTIQLKDGSTVRGVLKNENNFSFQVLGTDDRLHLLSSNEIERMVRDDASLMPSDFDQRLTAEELSDLIAYLSRLVR